jgi:hypothetical protein
VIHWSFKREAHWILWLSLALALLALAAAIFTWLRSLIANP